MTDTHWITRAGCTPKDAPLFARAGITGAAKRDIDEARYICLTCPVLMPCREDVMAAEGNRDTRGREEFRAGLTPRQRTTVNRNQRKARQASQLDQAARERLERGIAEQLEPYRRNP